MRVQVVGGTDESGPAGPLSLSATMRTRARIEGLRGGECCRIDVARSSEPVRARMSDKAEKFWVRMNNSTRALPDDEIDAYLRDRWGI